MNASGQSFMRKALRLFSAGVPLHLASDEIFAIRPGASIPAMLAYAPEGIREEPRKPYRMLDGGIAEISITGVLSQHPSLYRMFGCSNQPTLGELTDAVHQARADASVSGIMLFVKSPGGTVSGTPDLAAAVAEAWTVKPVHSYAQDEDCSAAYWVSCQASRLTAGRGAALGAIGTYAVLVDASKAAGAEGLKFHVISSGAFKGAGAEPGAGISAEQLAYFQERVDDTAALFAGDFAAGRGLSLKVAGDLADGRSYIAARAAGLGLCDGVGTYAEALAALVAAIETPTTQPRRAVPPPQPEPEPEDKITTPEPGEEEAMSDKKPAAEGAASAGEDIPPLRAKVLALLGLGAETAAQPAAATLGLTAEEIDRRIKVEVDARMLAAEVDRDLHALAGKVPPAVLGNAETRALLLDAKSKSSERYGAALAMLAGNDASALLGGPIASSEQAGEALAGLGVTGKELAALEASGMSAAELRLLNQKHDSLRRVN